MTAMDAGPSRSSVHMPTPASTSDLGAALDHSHPNHTRAVKISKRINKRLQLAAALIEADNDDIEQNNATEQFLRTRQRQQQQDPEAPGPAPLPQLKLASQSVIFAPFREHDSEDVDAPHTRRRTGSNASRLSRLSAGLAADERERRPSVDFLGVRLPTDKKSSSYTQHHARNSSLGSRPASAAGFSRHSRANSLMSATGPLRPGETVWGGPATGRASRPASALSHSRQGSLHAMAADAAAAGSDAAQSEAGSDEALSDWGVDKFLSKDTREKLQAGRTSRANSTVGIATLPATVSRPSSVISLSAPTRPQAMVRTHSEIGTVATGIPTAQDGSVSAAQAQLLARIKMYRERQENLPPSEWSGPGPAADASEVAKHLAGADPSSSADPERSAAALAANKRSSVAFPSAAAGTAEHDPVLAQRSPIKDAVASVFGVSAPRFTSAGGLDALSRDASAGGTRIIGLPSADADGPNMVEEPQLSADIKAVTHVRSATVESMDSSASGIGLQRRDSSMGILGESWSDQGDEDDSYSKELQNQTITASASREDVTLRLGDSQPTAMESATAAADATSDAGVQEPLETIEHSDMAGVGSFSRSQSRRNSMMTTLSGAPGTLWSSGANTTNDAPSLRPGDLLPPSRPATPGGLRSGRMSGQATPILGEGAALPFDPFSGMSIGPSPYPASHRASPAARLMELGADPYAAAEKLGPYPRGIAQSTPENMGAAAKARRGPGATASMSTKQLQEMARQSAFGGYYGIGSPGDSPVLQAADDAELLSAAGLNPLSAMPDVPSLVLQQEEDSGAYAALAEHLAEQDRRETSTSNDAAHTKARPFSSLFGGSTKAEKHTSVPAPSILATAAAIRASAVPDLSSVRWGSKKRAAGPVPQTAAPPTDYAGPEQVESVATTDKAVRKSLFNPISTLMGSGSSSALIEKLQKAADEQQRQALNAQALGDVDDSETSPASKGPLKPRGLAARIPNNLVMPTPLEGSPYAPKTRLTDAHGRDIRELRASIAQSGSKKTSLYVPDGFVLHDGRGLPPMKRLSIGAGGGPKLAFMESDGDKKHLTVVSRLLHDSRRTVNVPAAAPAGIGRRAAAPSTALFRNQLVQHDEERTGWGWEAGTQTGEGPTASSSENGDVPLAELKKISRAAKRAARKAEKERRKRKKARRERRRKRQLAETNGTSYESLGVESDSPAEDLDLSEDSEEDEDAVDEREESESEASFYSEDEKRWVDDKKPAGKLFGKSLLDVADERRRNLVSKNRAYGQIEAEEIRKFEAQAGALDDDGDARSIAPSTAARTFREHPLGYNDTRERMQAAFGKDALWEREMAVRREEEAREAAEREVKRLAELEYQKAKAERIMRKLKGKKGKKDQAKFEAAALAYGKLHKEITGREASFASRNPDSASIAPTVKDEENEDRQIEENQLPARSRTPIEPPRLDVSLFDESTPGGAMLSAPRDKRKGASEAAAEWFARESDDESSEIDSSEDEAEKRKQALERARRMHTQNSASVSFAAALNLPRVKIRDEDQDDTSNEDDSSSEDNVPLSQLRKKASPGITPSISLGYSANAAPRLGGDDDSSEEETPLADIVAKRKTRQSLAGKLDLDFMGGSAASLVAQSGNVVGQPVRLSSGALAAPFQSPHQARASSQPPMRTDDDSDDDAPLGLKHSNGLAALAELTKKEEELRRAQTKVADLQANGVNAGTNDESDDDDRPLGIAHPQAAIIAEQRALIEKLQAEAAEARAVVAAAGSGFGSGPAYGYDPRMSMMPPAAPFAQPGIAPGHASMLGMPGYGLASPFAGALPQSATLHHLGMPMGMEAPAMPPVTGLGPDPKATSIDRWRWQVPTEAQVSSSNSK